MSAIEFKLDAFEGPLDLLLFLVNRHKLNIYDIEIALLLDQYLEYMDNMEEKDFDQAGEFLAMAARLIYIKTCSLLPKPEEAEELKKELEGELIEYSMCKEAAARLRELCVFGDVFVRPPEKLPVNKVFTGTIDPQKLVKAYLGMSAKARSMKPVRAEQFDPIVTSRIVTVTSKIVHVLKMLYTLGHCSMAELYEGVEDKSARVATFLAVLELTKSGRVMLNEDNTEISFNRDSPRRKKPLRTTSESAETYDEPQPESEQFPEEDPAGYDNEQSEETEEFSDDNTNDTDDTEDECGYTPRFEIIKPRPALAAVSAATSAGRERYIGAAQSVRTLSVALDLPKANEPPAQEDFPKLPAALYDGFAFKNEEPVSEPKSFEALTEQPSVSEFMPTEENDFESAESMTEREPVEAKPEQVADETEAPEIQPSVSEFVPSEEEREPAETHDENGVKDEPVTESSDDNNSDNTEPAAETQPSPENAEETEYAAEKRAYIYITHGRSNRFALRYFWGYPADGNCLPYRRERL